MAASPTPSTAGATEPQSSGEIPWWAWALLLLVVAGLVAAVLLSGRRRGRAIEAWDRAQADAEDTALWLHDRVLPPVLADHGPAASATAWPAARPRVLELDEQLTALARNAPDDVRRAEVLTLRSALADTAAALDRRASSPSAQAEAAAQTEAVLADERLARALAHEAAPAVGPAPVPVPAPRPAPPAALAAPPTAVAPTPVPPTTETPTPASPDVETPTPAPPDDAGGPARPGDASGGGRHVRPPD